MLHQLLIALLGTPGTIVKHVGEAFLIDPACNFLSSPETTLLNELLQTGYTYFRIKQFIHAQITDTFTTEYPSIYRRAMAHAVNTVLKPYQEAILSIEQAFLEHRHFTFGNIRAELGQFSAILGEILLMIERIGREALRGGAIIDLLNALRVTGSEWTISWAGSVLRDCQRVFINQLCAWVVHGQIVDPTDQFFVHRVVAEHDNHFRLEASKKLEVTEWEMYTLAQSMVPRSMLGLESAGKLLFIGKAVKILKSIEGGQRVQEQVTGELRGVLQTEDYSLWEMEALVERIRHRVAKLMIQLIIDEKNLLKQMEKINNYYLMFCGQFYHQFLEEARGIERIAQKEKVQQKINDCHLPNTLLRIGLQEDGKRLSFEVKSLGFNYANFKHFLNIVPVGQVDLHSCIKFTASESAVWHRSKQLIQANFTTAFSLRFRKLHEQKSHHPWDQTNTVSFVLQNSQDILASSHSNPSTTASIADYICVNLGYAYSQKEHAYVSVLQIGVRNERNQRIEKCLAETKPKRLNFVDEAPHQVKISFTNEVLRVTVDSEQLEFKGIKIDSYLSLEMGRAHVGFLSRSGNPTHAAEIQQWDMLCKPGNHHGDHWSDLTLNLKVGWPISLILTTDLMDTFSRIHKFLFPIRRVQLQLEGTWMKITRKMKEEKAVRGIKHRQSPLNIFQRRLGATRSRMCLFLNNLWGYLQSDIAQMCWTRLRQSITEALDFEIVMAMIAKYAHSIQVMYFFNSPKIQKKINQLIRVCRSFVSFFEKIEGEQIRQMVMQELGLVEEQFANQMEEFYSLLKGISRTSSSHHLFHLTQRMQACMLLKQAA